MKYLMLKYTSLLFYVKLLVYIFVKFISTVISTMYIRFINNLSNLFIYCLVSSEVSHLGVGALDPPIIQNVNHSIVIL